MPVSQHVPSLHTPYTVDDVDYNLTVRKHLPYSSDADQCYMFLYESTGYHIPEYAQYALKRFRSLCKTIDTYDPRLPQTINAISSFLNTEEGARRGSIAITLADGLQAGNASQDQEQTKITHGVEWLQIYIQFLDAKRKPLGQPHLIVDQHMNEDNGEGEMGSQMSNPDAVGDDRVENQTRAETVQFCAIHVITPLTVNLLELICMNYNDLESNSKQSRDDLHTGHFEWRLALEESANAKAYARMGNVHECPSISFKSLMESSNAAFYHVFNTPGAIRFMTFYASIRLECEPEQVDIFGAEESLVLRMMQPVMIRTLYKTMRSFSTFHHTKTAEKFDQQNPRKRKRAEQEEPPPVQGNHQLIDDISEIDAAHNVMRHYHEHQPIEGGKYSLPFDVPTLTFQIRSRFNTHDAAVRNIPRSFHRKMIFMHLPFAFRAQNPDLLEPPQVDCIPENMYKSILNNGPAPTKDQLLNLYLHEFTNLFKKCIALEQRWRHTVLAYLMTFNVRLLHHTALQESHFTCHEASLTHKMFPDDKKLKGLVHRFKKVRSQTNRFLENLNRYQNTKQMIAMDCAGSVLSSVHHAMEVNLVSFQNAAAASTMKLDIGNLHIFSMYYWGRSSSILNATNKTIPNAPTPYGTTIIVTDLGRSVRTSKSKEGMFSLTKLRGTGADTAFDHYRDFTDPSKHPREAGNARWAMEIQKFASVSPQSIWQECAVCCDTAGTPQSNLREGRTIPMRFGLPDMALSNESWLGVLHALKETIPRDQGSGRIKKPTTYEGVPGEARITRQWEVFVHPHVEILCANSTTSKTYDSFYTIAEIARVACVGIGAPEYLTRTENDQDEWEYESRQWCLGIDIPSVAASVALFQRMGGLGSKLQENTSAKVVLDIFFESVKSFNCFSCEYFHRPNSMNRVKNLSCLRNVSRNLLLTSAAAVSHANHADHKNIDQVILNAALNFAFRPLTPTVFPTLLGEIWDQIFDHGLLLLLSVMCVDFKVPVVPYEIIADWLSGKEIEQNADVVAWFQDFTRNHGKIHIQQNNVVLIFNASSNGIYAKTIAQNSENSENGNTPNNAAKEVFCKTFADDVYESGQIPFSTALYTREHVYSTLFSHLNRKVALPMCYARTQDTYDRAKFLSRIGIDCGTTTTPTKVAPLFIDVQNANAMHLGVDPLVLLYVASMYPFAGNVQPGHISTHVKNRVINTMVTEFLQNRVPTSLYPLNVVQTGLPDEDSYKFAARPCVPCKRPMALIPVSSKSGHIHHKQSYPNLHRLTFADKNRNMGVSASDKFNLNTSYDNTLIPTGLHQDVGICEHWIRAARLFKIQHLRTLLCTKIEAGDPTTKFPVTIFTDVPTETIFPVFHPHRNHILMCKISGESGRPRIYMRNAVAEDEAERENVKDVNDIDPLVENELVPLPCFNRRGVLLRIPKADAVLNQIITEVDELPYKGNMNCENTKYGVIIPHDDRGHDWQYYNDRPEHIVATNEIQRIDSETQPPQRLTFPYRRILRLLVPIGTPLLIRFQPALHDNVTARMQTDNNEIGFLRDIAHPFPHPQGHPRNPELKPAKYILALLTAPRDRSPLQHRSHYLPVYVQRYYEHIGGNADLVTETQVFKEYWNVDISCVIDNDLHKELEPETRPGYSIPQQ